jgi:hypothetical protein
LEEAVPIDERIHPGGLEPAGDLVWVEAYALPPAQIRDPPLGDQPADVAFGDTEVRSEARDIEQVR